MKALVLVRVVGRSRLLAARAQIALCRAVLEIGVRLVSAVLLLVVRAVALETTRVGCVWAVMYLVLVRLAVGAPLDMLLRGALQVAYLARRQRLLGGTRLGLRVHLGHGRIVGEHQAGAGWDGVLCVVADASGFRWSGCVGAQPLLAGKAQGALVLSVHMHSCAWLVRVFRRSMRGVTSTPPCPVLLAEPAPLAAG